MIATSRSPARPAMRAARGLRDMLRPMLPQACQLCAAAAGSSLVCSACSAAMPRLDRSCARCGLPLSDQGACGSCLRRPPPFTRTIAPLVYAHPVDRLLQRLKYGHALALADWAADELASAVGRAVLARDSPAATVIVASLPLPPSRERERGFNQAALIGNGVAARLGFAAAPVLARVREGPPQAAQAWDARRRNVRDAFAATTPLRGARIAVVDDVMTTGATMREAARALLRAGAAEVEAWVVARTLPPQERA